MSQKLAVIRVVRINDSSYFVTTRKNEDGNAKTFAQIRREFERSEGLDADKIQPVAFMDKYENGARRVGDILEEKEFTTDDLPFVI